MNRGAPDLSLVTEDMKYYNIPGHENVTARWDELQRDLHCCGGTDWHYGYKQWGYAEAWKSGKSKEEGGMEGRVP